MPAGHWGPRRELRAGPLGLPIQDSSTVGPPKYPLVIISSHAAPVHVLGRPVGDGDSGKCHQTNMQGQGPKGTHT